MDVFAWLMIGILVAFLGGIVLLGLFSPRSGADVLGLRPTRSPEAEAAGEADDLAEMLEASNALRRRRSEPERTEEEVAAALLSDRREIARRAREHRTGR